MALLLGEDGRGYELARRLDGCGAWRTWLGDTSYGAFAHALASPATWDAFMSSRSHNLHLQLRARALLFDKASSALILGNLDTAAGGPSLSAINPTYLQLHEDDMYFSLEDLQDGVRHQTQSKPSIISPHKTVEHSYERTSRVGLRHNEPEDINTSQRYRLDDTWSRQCVEKHRMRYHKFTYGDKESKRRTSEGMSTYLKQYETHKRKSQTFKEEQKHSRVVSESNSSEDNHLFFPEIMFPSNCVPDTALSATNGYEENRKEEVFGVLDRLPTVRSKSPAMIERFGIKQEYLKVSTKYRGKGNRKSLCQEQARQGTHKVAAHLLVNSGFEGGTEVSLEILSEFIGSHIRKLGRTLKLLTDSYRQQFSSTEILKMFLHTAGYNNIGGLAEITKNVNKSFTNQSPQVRTLQPQHQNPLLQAQFQRQMHPQMNMLNPQNLTYQQQQHLENLRRRQLSTPRGPMMVTDKEHPMMEVKLESTMDSSIDGLNKHQQLIRHQVMGMASHHPQQAQQFKQLPPVQIPQYQTQSPYCGGRITSPVVKVESFHGLVGGDSTLKHEADHRKQAPTPK